MARRFPAPAFLCLPFLVRGTLMLRERLLLALLSPISFFQLNPPLFMINLLFGLLIGWMYSWLESWQTGCPGPPPLLHFQARTLLPTALGSHQNKRRVYGCILFPMPRQSRNILGTLRIRQVSGHTSHQSFDQSVPRKLFAFCRSSPSVFPAFRLYNLLYATRYAKWVFIPTRKAPIKSKKLTFGGLCRQFFLFEEMEKFDSTEK